MFRQLLLYMLSAYLLMIGLRRRAVYFHDSPQDLAVGESLKDTNDRLPLLKTQKMVQTNNCVVGKVGCRTPQNGNRGVQARAHGLEM